MPWLTKWELQRVHHILKKRRDEGLAEPSALRALLTHQLRRHADPVSSFLTVGSGVEWGPSHGVATVGFAPVGCMPMDEMRSLAARATHEAIG